MFLTENRVFYLPKIKNENMDYEKIVRDLDLQSENLLKTVPLNEGRKRMRLHQLSWEEKIQRKKLRNRIAAQTSRDRKKAKMDHLEESVKELKQQNELLFTQVMELKKKNEMLVDANTELQKALAQRSYTCSCLSKFQEDRKKIVERRNEIEEQICVEEGYSFERPAESSEIPRQKGHWPTSAQMLADFKEDKFLDDLERLASSLLEEVEQHEFKRDTKSLFQEISGTCQQECSNNIEMVGETSEKLESSRSKMNSTCTNQQDCFSVAGLTVEEKVMFISSEHSYAVPVRAHFPTLTDSKLNSDDIKSSVPTITITESEKISAIENELKKDIESQVFNNDCQQDNLDILPFPNFYSPRSEVSSDLGYESADSPYESEISKMDTFDDLNELWGDPFSDLFPELI